MVFVEYLFAYLELLLVLFISQKYLEHNDFLEVFKLQFVKQYVQKTPKYRSFKGVVHEFCHVNEEERVRYFVTTVNVY